MILERPIHAKDAVELAIIDDRVINNECSAFDVDRLGLASLVTQNVTISSTDDPPSN